MLKQEPAGILSHDEEEFPNPLDLIAEVLEFLEFGEGHRHVRGTEKLSFSASSRAGEHVVVFDWDSEARLLEFTLYLGVKIPRARRRAADRLLALLNESWSMSVGSFRISRPERHVYFHHGFPLMGTEGITPEQIYDILGRSCFLVEQFQSAFLQVALGEEPAREFNLAESLIPQGEA